jgi:hypothetical protein
MMLSNEQYEYLRTALRILDTNLGENCIKSISLLNDLALLSHKMGDDQQTYF